MVISTIKKATHSLILLSILLPTMVLASIKDTTQAAATEAGFNAETSNTTIAEIVGTVAQAFLSLLGVIFICYIIYGGFVWLTAAGNDEKVTKARNVIRDGIIGLVITLSAAGIYLFIKNVLISTA